MTVPAILLYCLFASLALAGQEPSPREKVLLVFSDPDTGFSFPLPNGWVGDASLSEDVKKRLVTTASRTSTAQAAQAKPLGIYLREPFSKQKQRISLRIDWIDDPNVAGVEPALLMEMALQNIRKQDPDFKVLEVPRVISLNGNPGGTFSVQHTSLAVETLDKTSVSRARLWFFRVRGGWIKANLTAAAEDWPALEKELKEIGSAMHFAAPEPPRKSSEEILDGLKF